MGRQTSPPISPSPALQPSQELGAVVAVPDQIVALPDQVAELPNPVVAPPDHAAALPLQPAAQPVGEGPPAAPQPVQPIPPPHDIEEISSSKSGEASVNFAPRGSGMELAVAHHLQPADESVAGLTTRHGIPMAFRMMAPSEATTVLN
ncbi:actin-binding protein wsp1-like [Andrographis paniculata]|uniref:actin-binding protein wsp1-like n=1 Tax=Andrographis paniculata TaxID=175694 RepID=UPI0021E84871|nr:actin-binding protein wsp1-like [Andrographis paniculata]